MLANLNDVLISAQKGKYGVGLFNALSLEMARGIIETAERLQAPVIVGTAEILLPYAPLESVADLLVPMAKRACVPVVVHYDHGLTFEKCILAMKLGFSSVMYDCSTDSYEENVRKTAELTRVAHALGVTVEAELGHVGDNDSSVEGNGYLADPAAYYTEPTQARDFVTRTGVDALAVAVGTAHGAYKMPPKLDFNRIEAIARTIPTPLVLHGGSGLADADFREAIRRGISKVNIFTDINVASAMGAQAAFAAGKRYMTDMVAYQIGAIATAVEEKMHIFGSVGRA
ncbi:class II fructose-bisphosphate aldolase [Ruthenibacterium lactatiformans]|uniref:class II fructose-bisphosphate aldolase n=1 Tax=Ruthenibacterium lactatiformans TaxID=1550024 RepID=UPI0022E0F119|nr:class II fructose-bisphosphate aldolase [Ruthenibacterium lactatiformans]